MQSLKEKGNITVNSTSECRPIANHYHMIYVGTWANQILKSQINENKSQIAIYFAGDVRR